MVSVLFTDFKNFTQASEILTPEELVAEINHCYSEFDRIITWHGIENIKTIGDAYMCAGSLPETNNTHPFDVVAAGLEMVKFIEENKR
ncbi:MAG: adenylate/guanylate cyclase domain-containing protein [Ferruginibacter sp.]|nr:adenylate/guanylate cyclase domain-containing protein [Ferruginibacter sp.]